MAAPKKSEALFRVLGMIGDFKPASDGYQAHCPGPAHKRGDKRPSLSIGVGSEGKVLLKCFGGCAVEDICQAIGITTADLFDRGPHGGAIRRFPMIGVDGTRKAVHVREDTATGKLLHWEQTNGKRGLNGTPLADLPLYRLPDLLASEPGSTVYVTEGETAADALAEHGLLAVGTATGAAVIPSDENLAPLRGHRVILWADNDEQGAAHMDAIAARFGPVDRLVWPDAPAKGDAADYFAGGGKAERLASLVHDRVTAAVPVQRSRLQVIRLADVQPESIAWLWRGRLARGKATLLMGDPGLGKSLISHWIAATISQGGAWPDGGTCQRGSAILFSTEDGLADTVVPRCLAAGADMTRIHAVQGVIEDPSDPIERMFALDAHLADLEMLIAETGASYVVMDPITAYLGPDVNSHKEADVRRVLGPVSLMAQRTGIVLLMVMHLNKGTGVSALYRSVGSIAFPAVARVVLGIAPDPNDEKRRLLLPIKMNIAADAQGIGYRIKTAGTNVLRNAIAVDQPPVLLWDNEPVTVTASSALDSSGTATEKGMKAEVKTVLIGLLPPGTRRQSRECWEAIKKETGCTSGSIVASAKADLGVISGKETFSGGWYWEMPQQSAARARITPQDSSDSSDSWVQQNANTDNDLSKYPQESEESWGLAREIDGEIDGVRQDDIGRSVGNDEVHPSPEHGCVGDPVADTGAVVRDERTGPGGPLPSASQECRDCGQPTENRHMMRCTACRDRYRMPTPEGEYPL